MQVMKLSAETGAEWTNTFNSLPPAWPNCVQPLSKQNKPAEGARTVLADHALVVHTGGAGRGMTRNPINESNAMTPMPMTSIQRSAHVFPSPIVPLGRRSHRAPPVFRSPCTRSPSTRVPSSPA